MYLRGGFARLGETGHRIYSLPHLYSGGDRFHLQAHPPYSGLKVENMRLREMYGKP